MFAQPVDIPRVIRNLTDGAYGQHIRVVAEDPDG